MVGHVSRSETGIVSVRFVRRKIKRLVVNDNGDTIMAQIGNKGDSARLCGRNSLGARQIFRREC